MTTEAERQGVQGGRRAIQARRDRIARAPRVGDVVYLTEARPGWAAVFALRVVAVRERHIPGSIKRVRTRHDAGPLGTVEKEWFGFMWRQVVRQATGTVEGPK